MKKCPFCAEEIQSEAVKCKYCKSDLAIKTTKTLISPKQSFSMSHKDAKILKILGIVVLIIIGTWLWYLGLPALVIWYLWKKDKKLSKSKKVTITAITTVVSIVMWVVLASISAPKLIILEPISDATVQTDSIEIKGSAKPKSAVIKINNKIISKNGDFDFVYKAPLAEEKNTILIEATNDGKITSKTFLITRTFTAEELAQYKQQKTDEETKRQADAIAQKEANQKAEAERAKQLAAALSKMTTKKDDIKNTTFYYDKTSPQSNNVNNINLYIVKPADSTGFLRLKIQYEGNDWLFIKKYIIKTDDRTFEIIPDKIERDNYTRVWEWSDMVVDNEQLNIIRAVIASKEAKIRSEGQTYYDDRVITKAEKTALQNVLDAFESIK